LKRARHTLDKEDSNHSTAAKQKQLKQSTLKTVSTTIQMPEISEVAEKNSDIAVNPSSPNASSDQIISSLKS
jgi:hypothetical protein